MDSSAPSSRLMTSIRSGFKKQGGLTLAQSPAPQVDPMPPLTPAISAPSLPPTSSPSASLSLQDNLQILDQVLSEVEQSQAITPVSQPAFDPAAQVVPQVVAQATDTLNVSYARPATAKETAAATPMVEAATGIQFVEEEKTPEIPVEVESYLQKVEEAEIQLPNEIVIADQTQAPLAAHYVKQPVIVLPITPEIEKNGARKNPFQSIRWLVEFSHKIMKMFTGKVVYREVSN